MTTRVVGSICFQKRSDVNAVIGKLKAAGFESAMSNIIDFESGAVFMEAWRDVTADEQTLPATVSAIYDEINKIVDPIDGLCAAFGAVDADYVPFGPSSFWGWRPDLVRQPRMRPRQCSV